MMLELLRLLFDIKELILWWLPPRGAQLMPMSERDRGSVDAAPRRWRSCFGCGVEERHARPKKLYGSESRDYSDGFP
jgi:hypothetical protein